MLAGMRLRWVGRWLLVVGAPIAGAFLLVAGAGAAEHELRSPSSDPGFQAVLLRERLAEERERQRRASPEARQERLESRTAHRGLSDGEARELAKRKFARFMLAPVYRGPRLQRGERIVRHLDDSTAVVARDGEEQRGLLQSQVPLLASTEEGGKAPVDLGLVETSEGFEPRNSPARVVLGRRAGAGVRFARAGFGLRPEGARDREAQVVEDKLFFANVATDTDLIVAPTVGGVEVSAQLRSSESPERLSLAVDLPAGAELRRVAGDSGAAEVVRGGKQLGVIEPPMAADADGEQVPAEYEIDGNRLHLDVGHRGQDVLYPVLLDPRVWEGWDWHDGLRSTGGWEFASRQPVPGAFGGDVGYYSNWGWGLRLYTKPNTAFTSEHWAEWHFRAAPRDSYVTRFNYWWLEHQVQASLLLMGVLKRDRSAWDNDAVRAYRELPTGYNENICVGPVGDPADPCDYNWGTDRNQAVFMLWMVGTPALNTQAVGLMGEAFVILSDRNYPTVTQAPSDTGWVDGEATLSATVAGSDAGLGMYALWVRGPPGSGMPSRYAQVRVDNDPAKPYCTGRRGAYCPASATATIPYSVSALPEGNDADNTVSAEAQDIIDRHSGTDPKWQVKVDRSPPSGELSGGLWSERDKPSLYKSRYGLNLGGISDAYAGVKSVEVKVDGERRFYREQECSTTSQCPGSMSNAEWDFVTDDYADGAHEITVHVKDPIAHESADGTVRDRHTKTFEWDVNVDHRAGELKQFRFVDEPLNDRMRARVNVSNGNLLLEENDLRIRGTGLNLNLSRFYNSRRSQTAGPLGYGWSLSAGEDVELDRLDDGDIRMFGPSGFVARFNKKDDGSFDTPRGVDGELKRIDGGYELKMDRSQMALRFSDEHGGVLTSRRDRNENQIDYGYDADGHMTSITDTQDRRVTLSYTNGLLRSVTDSTGRQWQFGYNEPDKELITYTDPDGKVTRFGYGANHRLETITDPRGAVTEVVYEGNTRRVSSVRRARSTDAERTTRFEYSYGDPECPEGDDPAEDITDVFDDNNHRTRYCRDEGKKEFRGADDVRRVIDARDNKRNLSYTPEGNVATFDDGAGADTTATYSGRDLTSVEQPTGATTSFSYGANGAPAHTPSGSQDAQGNSMTFGYNSSGNLRSTQASGSGQPAVTLVQLDYNHQDDEALCDGAGHTENTGPKGTLRCSEDGNGHETRYDYDDKGNLLEKDPPGPHGGVKYTYDDLSRVDTVTDADDNKADLTYDPLDRVTSVTWYDGTEQVAVTTYSYDENGNRTSRSDAQGTTSYTFDERNQLTLEQLPGGATNAYSYDGVGNMLSFTDAGGQVLYSYNAVNLVETVVEPSGSGGTQEERTTTFHYNARNRRDRTVYPNGVTQEVDFADKDRSRDDDASSKIEQIRAFRGSEDLLNLEWSYRNAQGADRDLRQTMEDHRRHERTSFSYDHLNRLTVADTNACSEGDCTEDREYYGYSFDSNSNRLEFTRDGGGPDRSYAYSEANELCWVYDGSEGNGCGDPPEGATTFDYDNNGNLTSASDGLDIDYNAKDQTTSIDPPGEPATTFDYLGDGQQERSRRGTTAYSNSLLGLSSERQGVEANYWTRDPNGGLVSQRTTQGRHYYLSDSLGSVMALTREDGSVSARYRYDPFGNVHEDSFDNVPNPFRFAGEHLDQGTRLYKIGARYYDPRLGRWTQRDPLDQVTEPRQSNRYGYAAQDPVNVTDPSGRDGTIDFDILTPKGGIKASIGWDDNGFPLHGGLAIGAGADLGISYSSAENPGGVSPQFGVTGCLVVYCGDAAVGFVPGGDIQTQSSGGWGLGLGAGVYGGTKF